MKNFINWLLYNYIGTDCAFGDLANDIDNDPNFPSNIIGYDFNDIEQYLISQCACRECIETLNDAYTYYKETLR